MKPLNEMTLDELATALGSAAGRYAHPPYTEAQAIHDELARRDAERDTLRGRLGSVEEIYDDFLAQVWAIASEGKYGEWDYPAQIVRFLKELVEKKDADAAALRERVAALEAENAALKQQLETAQYYNKLAERDQDERARYGTCRSDEISRDLHPDRWRRNRR